MEFLNDRLKSTTVALVVLVSRREPHHLTFEAQEFIPGFNCYIWIYKFHNDRLVRTLYEKFWSSVKPPSSENYSVPRKKDLEE